MCKQPTPADIAIILSAAWHRLTSETLAIQFREIVGVELAEPSEVDRLFIGLSNTCDFEERLLSTNCVRWWQVDENGIKEIEVPAFRFNKTKGIYKRPVFHFFVKGNRVLLKEVLGDSVIIRRIGECVRKDGEWRLTFDQTGFG